MVNSHEGKAADSTRLMQLRLALLHFVAFGWRQGESAIP